MVELDVEHLLPGNLVLPVEELDHCAPHNQRVHASLSLLVGPLKHDRRTVWTDALIVHVLKLLTIRRARNDHSRVYDCNEATGVPTARHARASNADEHGSWILAFLSFRHEANRTTIGDTHGTKRTEAPTIVKIGYPGIVVVCNTSKRVCRFHPAKDTVTGVWIGHPQAVVESTVVNQ